MPSTTRRTKIKISICDECRWFHRKFEVWGMCRGHAPKPSKGINDPCHWPVVHFEDPVCSNAEPIE